MADHSGQRIDHYQLMRRLGEGSFGDVYLAEDLYHNRNLVAIKLLPQLADRDIASFLNEARTIRLKHPNIVEIQDFGIENHTPFIIMTYAPHGTLRQRHPKGTRLSLDNIVYYVNHIASALQYAHDERVVHRDIKPENLLLGSRNEVLVSDFGIATIVSSSHSQNVLEMAGTISYMAPEQIQGKPSVASDQYSLAVVVFEWLCGERPFIGTSMEIATQHMLKPPPSLHEKVPMITYEVEQILLTALAKDSEDRFKSILAFATALEQAYREQLQQKQNALPASNAAVLPLTSQGKRLPETVVKNVPFTMSDIPVSPLTNISGSPLSSQYGMPPKPGVSAPKVDVSTYSNSMAHMNTRKFRSRFFNRKLVLSILLVLILVVSGTYFFVYGRGSIVDVDATLNTANGLIVQAQKDINANPANPTNALQELSLARIRLLSVQNNSLNGTQNTYYHNLRNTLTLAVNQAITAYNHLYNIASLPCVATPSTGITADITKYGNMVVFQDVAGQRRFYVLADDKQLYALNGQQLGTKIPVGADTNQVEAIATDGTRLIALVSLPNKEYQLSLLLPQTNSLHMVTSVVIAAPTGYIPVFVTLANNDVSVILLRTGSTQPQIVTYTIAGAANTQHFNPPTKTMTSISNTIVSVAALSVAQKTQLLFLLSDGRIQSLPLSNGNSLSPGPGSVQITPSIASPLTVSAANFTNVQNPVPTPASKVTSSLTALSVAGATMLATGPTDLYIVAAGVNGVSPRILDLKAAPTPPSSTIGNAGGGVAPATDTTLYMTLMQQYAISLPTVKGVAVDPKGDGFYMLALTGQKTSASQLVSVTLPVGKTCVS